MRKIFVNRGFRFFTLLLFLLAQLSGLSLLFPQKTSAAALTAISATLGNARMSYYGKAAGSHAAGVSTITLDTTGNADNNANNIFPGDAVAVGINGGLTVASRSADMTKIILDQPLAVTVADQAAIYASQAGSLVVAATIANDIPVNGYLLITIPDPDSDQNGKHPHTAADTATNGFDANGIGTGDWSTTGGTGCTWGTETWTAGSGAGHTYKVVTTTQCTAGTITATLDASPGLLNPAPVTTGHTQGVADTYQILVQTFDAANQLIDEGNTMVAPIEGVFVSATIAETISFTVAGVAAGTSVCGQTQSSHITTTATAIPFGTMTSPNVATAAQKLTVSTNAASYIVTIEENDQLSIDGLGTTTIADTICDLGSCTHSTSGEWKTGYNPAKGNFGYSMANVVGSDASFVYNESSRIFSAKQLPEYGTDFTPPTTSPQTIMTQSTPVNNSQVYVCYMLAYQVTQQAGYYYNKVKYTATPTF